MIKGLAITPPVLGRISIGKVVHKQGQRLPEKDDQFTITSQLQNQDGWIKHPLDEQLRSKNPDRKLRTIPVRMIFNDPELNLRAEYTLFDRQTGRPLCRGNGETCQRRTAKGIEQHPCPSPELCPIGQNGLCKPYGRLYVNLDASDEFGTFVFRTTGYNSIRTLAARLAYYHAASSDRLSCLPLQLTLRGKSTTQSYRTPVYYVDITLQDGMSLNDAIQQAQQLDQQCRDAGYIQEAVDFMARQGYANAGFDVEIEDEVDGNSEHEAETQNQSHEPHQQSGHAEQSKANSTKTAKLGGTNTDTVKAIKTGLAQSVKAVV